MRNQLTETTRRGPIGWGLRCWRLERRLTIRAVAEMLGCTHVYVVEMENGTKTPTATMCATLAGLGLPDAQRLAMLSRINAEIEVN